MSRPCDAMLYWMGTVRGNRTVAAPAPVRVRMGRATNDAWFADGSALKWRRRSGGMVDFITPTEPRRSLK